MLAASRRDGIPKRKTNCFKPRQGREPGTAGRRRHQRWSKNPDGISTARGAAPNHHDGERDNEQPTAKPGEMQQPRNKSKNEPEVRRTPLAARSADAERSTNHKTDDKTQPRRKACRGARGSRPRARKQKEGPRRGNRTMNDEVSDSENTKGRGAQPRVLLICPTASCHRSFRSTALRIFSHRVNGYRRPNTAHRLTAARERWQLRSGACGSEHFHWDEVIRGIAA